MLLKVISISLAGLLFTAAGCKTARYEFVGNKGKSGANGQNSGADDKIGPKPGTDDATSQLPPDAPGENIDEVPLELPPTARVEVIEGGVVVTTTQVNRKVSVTPSADTLDGDNAADPGNCPNPGIIEARYDFGDGVTKTVKREPHDCKSLAIEYSWKTDGLYEIKLVVVSDEKEEAQAGISFRVTKTATPPPTESSSFKVSVTPTITTPKSNVTAVGNCSTPTPNRVSWDYGDGESGSGIQTVHQYSNSGQYIVTGLCVDQSGLTLESSTTILVSSKIPGGGGPGPKPTASPNPNPNPNPNPQQTPSPTQGSNPVQTPGQTPGQN